MFQLRKNVMDVSYHIVQYSNIITELREEIKRLRIKLDNQQSYGNKPSIQAVQCMYKLFPTKVNDSEVFPLIVLTRNSKITERTSGKFPTLIAALLI